MIPNLHFERAEFDRRLAASRKAAAARGLAGLLLFRQESMYYLTGYDTFGFCFFQCLYVGVDGALVLLTRNPDRRQAEMTSIIGDIRTWADGADADPAADLADIVLEQGARGERLGVEYAAHGLTAALGRQVDAAVGTVAMLEDASDLVDTLRLVKSPAEIAHVRQAAALADDAWAAALATAKPGASEAEVLAAMHTAVFGAGGDYPGNPFIIGSGPRARLCRYASGRRVLEAGDQLTLEFAGIWRQYHACLMRTVTVGAPDNADAAHLFRVARDTLLACEDALCPGRSVGDVYAAHARALDAAGLRHARMTACGYSLGAVYPPSWMDRPMIYRDNPVTLAPGMVFFIHIIIFDDDRDLAMTLGRTNLVTDGAAEPLSDAILKTTTPG